MNFTTMEYFLQVEKERSFSKAAEKLHLTQQTLSAHIGALEKELGSSLFVRHIPLELTYEGGIFLNYARNFSNAYDAMKREFADLAVDPRGVLKVGIAHTRGRVLMPDIIQRFRKKWPGYEVQLIEASNEELRKKLTEGDVDLAIGIFAEESPGLRLYTYYTEEVQLLLSRKLLQRMYEKEDAEKVVERLRKYQYEDLRKIPFVMGSPGDVAAVISGELFARNGISPVVCAQTDNIATILALCARGVGACFSPNNLLEVSLSGEEMEMLEIIRLEDFASYPIRFGILQRNEDRKIILEFIKAAKEVQTRQV